jgi:hypothetical protein
MLPILADCGADATVIARPKRATGMQRHSAEANRFHARHVGSADMTLPREAANL